MQLFCDDDVFTMELYNCEKEMYFSYQDEFKKLLNKLQENFSEVKKTEKIINNVILNLKNELNSISDEFKLTEKDGKFFNLIKDINNTKSLPINVNMSEALKLFYSYIVEFEKSFTTIDEISKKKTPEK